MKKFSLLWAEPLYLCRDGADFAVPIQLKHWHDLQCSSLSIISDPFVLLFPLVFVVSVPPPAFLSNCYWSISIHISCLWAILSFLQPICMNFTAVIYIQANSLSNQDSIMSGLYSCQWCHIVHFNRCNHIWYEKWMWRSYIQWYMVKSL